MKIHLHQTHHTIGDFDQTFSYLKEQIQQAKEGLHLFPECFLFGYPAQDLYLQPSSIHRYQHMLKEMSAFCSQQKKSPHCLFLIGGPEYQLSPDGTPQALANTIYQASPGTPLTPLYRKQVLPFYDIFDDHRYFTPGTENKVLKFCDKKIGLLICEDMWYPAHHLSSPIQRWWNEKEELHIIINLSASPFHIRKNQQRILRAREVCRMLKAPLAYVNRVGGEDELLFDGGSFVFDGNTTIAQGPLFKSAQISCDCPTYHPSHSKEISAPTNETEKKINPWKVLYQPNLDHNTPPHLVPLTHEELNKVVRALCFGLQDYAAINQMKSFLVALSGGLDSALVLALAHLAAREHNLPIEALIMPGLYSSPASRELAEKMCQNLHIPCQTLPIKFLHASCRHAFLNELETPLEGTANENIQSRLRGAILSTRSNQTGAMVLNTSNKSEISVGYTTQYGDSIGALSPLGDLYKSELYQLAPHLNQHYRTQIPQEIIKRPPSAELKENQIDQNSLPPYPILDAILEGLLSYALTPNNLVELGHQKEQVVQVERLYLLAEYKRRQFCPIIKVKPKSFGTGYRVPVAKHGPFSIKVGNGGNNTLSQSD